MSKAFTKEDGGGDAPDDDLDDDFEEETLPSGNYMTPQGFRVLAEELRWLLRDERPRITEIVSWAAGNGDRSENGDYLYNKKRLREIDRRIRYLTKRTEGATVVDPAQQQGIEQVFFGATVTYAREDDTEITVKLVGVDEADMTVGKVNWQSPVGRALLKGRVGDEVDVRIEGRVETLEIIEIQYRLEQDQ
ncbi:MAG: transcription elongation factor GreB [Micavibrio aeruginosavorus]|uniref:Transcription elongation factor GreB n=1 Tax=Micavibrio aeruginosavorus TaxID=349221 RepID=A0A2W5MT96_9BACT|nr:MAG: transcription elongation factor GreB [Micavibrio aeruginosavorus]